MDNTNKIYQAGEVLPTLPGVPTQVANLSTPKPVIPTIEASKLGTAVGNIPATTIPNTANQNLGLQISSSMIQPVAPAPTQTPAPTVDRNTIIQSLMDLINKQGTKGAATISAQEDAGVFKQQEELTRLQNEYTAKEQAYLKQEEELNKNAEGLSEQGLKIRRDELSRKKNSELADISIQANMAKGLYDTAFSIAESKINAEFEPIQAQIDGLKNVYSFLQSDLTDSEKLQAQAIISEQQSQADFARQKALLGYKAMIDMANFSSQSGFNLSPQQETRLNGIINTYSKDGIIQQGQQAQQIYNITDAIIANPNNPGNQLTALYTLVKNLDPDSAVREGELDLANKTNTFIGKYQDSLTRISTGRVLNPKATIELANAAQALADEWVNSAERRQTQYGSQANVFGLSDPFNTYLAGFAGFAKRPGTNNDESEQIFQEVTGTDKGFFGNVFSGIGNFFSRNNSFK